MLHSVYVAGSSYYSIHNSSSTVQKRTEREREKWGGKGRERKSAGNCRNAKQLQIYASIIFDEFI